MDKIQTDLNVGEKIFDNVPESVRPNWGGLILSRFDEAIKNIPDEISELYQIIDDQGKWNEAHNQFTRIRKLALENRKPELEIYLLLAECVAKVTYNSSESPAPFDYDSGFYIPKLALELANELEDEYLYEEVRSTILIFNQIRISKKNKKASIDLIKIKKIDDILWVHWDPIGINDDGPRDEYRLYVYGIQKLIENGSDRIKIAKQLLNIEQTAMSMTGDYDNCLKVADKLLEI